jgi:hypothetical protein
MYFPVSAMPEPISPTFGEQAGMTGNMNEVKSFKHMRDK